MDNSEKDISTIMASAVCDCGTSLWFSSLSHNGLYKHNLDSNETRFVSFFPYDDRDKWKLHCGSIKYEGFVIFYPDRSNYVSIFDIESGEFNCCKIKNNDFRGGFYTRSAINDKLYFVIYDEDAELIEYDPIKNIRRIITLKKDIHGEEIYTSTCEVIFGKVVFAGKNEDYIYFYDPIRDEINSIKIDAEGKGFGTISFYDNEIILSSIKNIYCLSIEREIIKIQNIIPLTQSDISMTVLEGEDIIKHKFFKEFLKNEKPFSFSLISGEELIFMPFRTDNLVVLKKEKGVSKIRILDTPNMEKETDVSMHRNGRLAYCRYIRVGEGFVSTTSQMYYNGLNEGFWPITFLEDKERYKMLLGEDDNNMVCESKEYNFSDFITTLCHIGETVS